MMLRTAVFHGTIFFGRGYYWERGRVQVVVWWNDNKRDGWTFMSRQLVVWQGKQKFLEGFITQTYMILGYLHRGRKGIILD